MRGGFIGSVCFLAFLLLQCTNGQNVKLTSQIPLSESNNEVNDDKVSVETVASNSAESVSSNSGQSQGLSNKDGNTSALNEDDLKTHNVTQDSLEGEQSIFSSTGHSEEENKDRMISNDLRAGEDEDNILEKSGYSSAFASSSPGGNSFAQANALSQAGSNTYPELDIRYMSPYGSIFPNLGSSSAQSYGNAQAGISPQNAFLAPPSPYSGLGSSYSSADANAYVQGNNNRWNPFGLGGNFPDLSYASAAPQFQDYSGGWNPYGLNAFNPDSSFALSQAEIGGWSPYSPGYVPAEAQVTSIGLYEPGNARLILPYEYVIPRSISGQDEIVCIRAGDLYNILTLDDRCLICTCSEVRGQLMPVCVGCNSCSRAPPEPEPEPEPLPIPIPVPPLPPPESQVSCSPLPDDTPFQNPLNPCQICICKHVFNAIGHPDVQIQCQENPECGMPPEIIPIPPIPEPPIPVPMPLCEKFPPDIPFPHPTESCKLCKCVVEILSFGIPEQRIICMPNPECEREPLPIPEPLPPLPEPWPIPEILPPVPEPWPIPEPIPPIPEPWPIPEQLPPIPEPVPIPEQFPPIPEPLPPAPVPWPIPEFVPPAPEPWPIPEPLPPAPEPWPMPLPEPLPEVIPEPQPLPWPPVVPDLPSSPLPGPGPHESCRPYPPNIPFQHPWDDCRVCVCSEFHATGIVNIEVNCFTKPSCCIELPFSEPPQQPLPLPPPEPQIIPEPIQYLEPQPPPLQLPPAPQPIQYLDQSCQYQDIGSEFINPEDVCKVCTCQLFGNFVAPVCRWSSRPECNGAPAQTLYNNLVFIEPKCRYQLPNQLFVVNCNVCSCHPVFNYVIARCTPQPNCDIPLISPGGSFSSADASASSYGLAESSALAQAQSVSESFLTNSASAEAMAQALSQVNPNIGTSAVFSENLANTGNEYPFGVVFPGSAEASASAQSNAILNLPPDTNAYPYYDANGYAGSESQASAQAITSVAPSPLNVLGGQAYSSAEALATSQLYPGLYGSYPYYTGMPGLGQMQPSSVAASQLYPGLYQYPVSQMAGLYQPGMAGWEGSLLGQVGGTNVQNLRQLSAVSGRPLIRSGPGLCKYNGDKYHHNCQACYCFQDNSGTLFTLCLGSPCA